MKFLYFLYIYGVLDGYLPLKNSGKDIFSISWISSILNHFAVSGIFTGSILGAKFEEFCLGTIS